MTVIAWDGKTFACDRQSSVGDKIATRTKLFRFPGIIGACAGDTDRGLVMREWVKNGRKQEDWPAFQRTDNWSILVIVTPEGVFEYNQEPVPILCEDSLFAWGCGHAFATGAMAHGASAVEAVRIASRYCNTCGMGVDWVNVKEEFERQANGSR